MNAANNRATKYVKYENFQSWREKYSNKQLKAKIPASLYQQLTGPHRKSARKRRSHIPLTNKSTGSNTLYGNSRIYILFKYSWTIYQKDYILRHETNNKFKAVEKHWIYSMTLPRPLKLEINNRKMTGWSLNTLQLSSIVLYNPQVKEEVSKENKKNTSN